MSAAGADSGFGASTGSTASSSTGVLVAAAGSGSGSALLGTSSGEEVMSSDGASSAGLSAGFGGTWKCSTRLIDFAGAWRAIPLWLIELFFVSKRTWLELEALNAERSDTKKINFNIWLLFGVKVLLTHLFLHDFSHDGLLLDSGVGRRGGGGRCRLRGRSSLRLHDLLRSDRGGRGRRRLWTLVGTLGLLLLFLLLFLLLGSGCLRRGGCAFCYWRLLHWDGLLLSTNVPTLRLLCEDESKVPPLSEFKKGFKQTTLWASSAWGHRHVNRNCVEEADVAGDESVSDYACLTLQTFHHRGRCDVGVLFQCQMRPLLNSSQRWWHSRRVLEWASSPCPPPAPSRPPWWWRRRAAPEPTPRAQPPQAAPPPPPSPPPSAKINGSMIRVETLGTSRTDRGCWCFVRTCIIEPSLPFLVNSKDVMVEREVFKLQAVMRLLWFLNFRCHWQQVLTGFSGSGSFSASLVSTTSAFSATFSTTSAFSVTFSFSSVTLTSPETGERNKSSLKALGSKRHESDSTPQHNNNTEERGDETQQKGYETHCPLLFWAECEFRIIFRVSSSRFSELLQAATTIWHEFLEALTFSFQGNALLGSAFADFARHLDTLSLRNLTLQREFLDEIRSWNQTAKNQEEILTFSSRQVCEVPNIHKRSSEKRSDIKLTAQHRWEGCNFPRKSSFCYSVTRCVILFLKYQYERRGTNDWSQLLGRQQQKAAKLTKCGTTKLQMNCGSAFEPE